MGSAAPHVVALNVQIPSNKRGNNGDEDDMKAPSSRKIHNEKKKHLFWDAQEETKKHTHIYISTILHFKLLIHIIIPKKQYRSYIH